MLILGGFAPLKLPQVAEMGIALEPLLFLLGPASNQKSFGLSIPTFGPAILASYLQHHGVQVAIKDFYFDEVDGAEADIVGISSTFMGEENVKEIAERVREAVSAHLNLGDWGSPAPSRTGETS